MSRQRILIQLFGWLLFVLLLRTAVTVDYRWGCLLLIPVAGLFGREIQAWALNRRYSMRRAALVYLLAAHCVGAMLTVAQWYLLYWHWLLPAPFLLAAVIEGLLWKLTGRIPPAVSLFIWCFLKLRVWLWHRWGVGRRRPADPLQPKGYCPNCAYPVNPGQCSECGWAVTRENLLRRPPLRIRRHLWKLAAALLIAAVPTGLYFTYHHYPWYKRCTVVMLIRLHHRNNQLAGQELVRRYQEGKLPQKEKDALFADTLKAQLSVRSPHPSDVGPRCNLIIQSSLSRICHGKRYILRHCVVRIDGSVHDDGQGKRDAISENMREGSWRIELPQLSAGAHEVEVEGLLTISEGVSTNDIDLYGVYTGPVFASVDVQVQDRPSGEYFTPLPDADVQQRLDGPYKFTARRTVFMQYDQDTHQMVETHGITLNASFRRAPAPGWVYFRTDSKGEYQRLSHCYLENYWFCELPREQQEWARGGGVLDLHFQYDPRIAIFEGPPELSAVIDRDFESHSLAPEEIKEFKLVPRGSTLETRPSDETAGTVN